MTISRKAKSDEWFNLDPQLGTELIDARLQLHHAAQLVAALGISYLAKEADDSHTNMQWFAGTLASQPVGPRPFRLGVRPVPFSLVILGGDAELAVLQLNGKTMRGAERWIRGQVATFGLDADQYTLAKHYTIPPHPVQESKPFDSTDVAKFEEMRRWYSNAALIVGAVAGAMPDASPVRCWPHHFDMASLITVAPGRSINLGMEPGDNFYEEPYWYASMSPAPGDVQALPELGGDGMWHTRDFIGAVLPASRMIGGPRQRSQVKEFLGSAARSCVGLLVKPKA